jgi:hypothetical protein
MRTWFGLILKITVRTKSYAPPKSRYFTKQPDSQVKLSLFSGYLPGFSQDFPVRAEDAEQTSKSSTAIAKP